MIGPASTEIITRIRKMVITGELTPGLAVTEVRLAELVGCGRTPLREALRQLSHSYLVIIAPRQGILIPPLDIVDFQQAHEAMWTAGGVCAELAVERIDEKRLEELRRIVAAQEKVGATGDPYDLCELDYRFHTSIAEATSNRYLADSAHRLHSSLARFIYAGYAAQLGPDSSIAEHKEIVEAMASGDPGLAGEKWREHTVEGRRRLLRILGVGKVGGGQ